MRGLAVSVCIVTTLLTAGCSKSTTKDDLLFIHHSCGLNWLNRPRNFLKRGLHAALLRKPYIHERNDITYGTVVEPDPGRPDSLGPVAGDKTDMQHWVLWFNDYLEHLKTHGCTNGVNRIIMFKSCFPNSDISGDGTAPGDPFSEERTLANYQAVFRHPAGSGNTYTQDGQTYLALENVFAANPGFLFIPVTAPPLESGSTSDENARRARQFNDWLKGDWLEAYRTRTGLRNVAVFDWFDLLAYADDHGQHPNRLREDYGWGGGNSHPNAKANGVSTKVFAGGQGSFIDKAWQAFQATAPSGGDDTN